MLLSIEGCTMEKPYMIEDGVYRIPLILPESLESKRNELEQTLLAAQRHLRTFAIQNGWGDLIKESFADSAEIYDCKDKFDLMVIKLCDLDPSTKVPKTTCSGLEKRVLISVSPLLYSQIYPEGIEEKSFEKLLTHEMAHRLHIRILDGEEDAMGPIWFFEGLAIYAAGQFENYNPKMEPIEIQKIVESTKRESYKKYVAVLRYFLKKVSIQELVEHARDKDFVKWLRQI